MVWKGDLGIGMELTATPPDDDLTHSSQASRSAHPVLTALTTHYPQPCRLPRETATAPPRARPVAGSADRRLLLHAPAAAEPPITEPSSQRRTGS